VSERMVGVGFRDDAGTPKKRKTDQVFRVEIEFRTEQLASRRRS
jgi:hypothetical protein